MIKKILCILLPLLTIASIVWIFSNSVMESAEASEKTGSVAKVVIKAVETVTKKPANEKKIKEIVPKWGHHIEFCAFAFFFTASLYVFGQDLSDAAYRIMFCGLMGAVTDEYIQTFSKGRGSRITDVLVDFSGILLGYGLMRLVVFVIDIIKKKTAKTKTETLEI